jgi:hypothetical protein
MNELVSKEALVDEALAKAVGPVDSFVGDAIVGICHEKPSTCPDRRSSRHWGTTGTGWHSSLLGCGTWLEVSTALTLDRLLEAVLGPGACFRSPEEDEARLPWLTPSSSAIASTSPSNCCDSPRPRSCRRGIGNAISPDHSYADG